MKSTFDKILVVMIVFLLIDTGINSLSEEEILAFYDLTQVPVEIQQIDLDHFRAKVIEVLR